MILSKEQARAHERKGQRLLTWMIVSSVAAIASFGLELEWLSPLLFIAAALWNLLLLFYILKDLHLRGASALWAFVPGFNVLVWLVWRRWHPLRIREW